MPRPGRSQFPTTPEFERRRSFWKRLLEARRALGGTTCAALDLGEVSARSSALFLRRGKTKGGSASCWGRVAIPALLWKVQTLRPDLRDRWPAWPRERRPTRTPTRPRPGEPIRPRFVLMVGDQIYADHASTRLVPFGRADTYQEFRDRYLDGVRLAQRIRRLMRTAAHLHDPRRSRNRRQLVAGQVATLGQAPSSFTIAIDAYLSYQWSHGPRTWGRRLYYRFDCGGFPFFVLDTRTQRFLEGKPKGDLARKPPAWPSGPSHADGAAGPAASACSPGCAEQQAEARQTRRSSSSRSGVFVPSPMSARTAMGRRPIPKRSKKSDGWPGFPNTRAAILRRDRGEPAFRTWSFSRATSTAANLAEIRF